MTGGGENKRRDFGNGGREKNRFTEAGRIWDEGGPGRARNQRQGFGHWGDERLVIPNPLGKPEFARTNIRDSWWPCFRAFFSNGLFGKEPKTDTKLTGHRPPSARLTCCYLDRHIRPVAHLGNTHFQGPGKLSLIR